MGAENDILNVARAELGYVEARTNRTKYGRWFGRDGGPWCDMFVSWCANEASVLDVVGKYAYTPTHARFFKRRGQWHNGSAGIGPGDIIFFQFARANRINHVGIVERASGGRVHTIEGNTSSSSQRNGGGSISILSSS